MMRVDVLIRWEIDAINFALHLLSQEAERARAGAPSDESYGPDLPQPERDLASSAYQFAARAALYELNGLVEWLMLALSNWTLSPEQQNDAKLLRRSRAQSEAILSRQYEITMDALPQYQDILRLRDEVNALKHRGGTLLEGEAANPVPGMSCQVQCTPERAEEYSKAVLAFLLALWSKVEAIRKHAHGNDSNRAAYGD